MALNDVTNEGLVHAIYPSDNGKNYIVRLKAYRATAGQFALVGASGAPTPDGYLPGNIKMRHVRVKIDAGQTGPGRIETVPFADVSHANWTTGGSAITVDGITAKVIGRTGEKTKFL